MWGQEGKRGCVEGIGGQEGGGQEMCKYNVD